MFIDAEKLDYRSLNEAIRAAGDTCHITGCLGQRFIAAGMSGKKIEIDGIPGNALGAYLGGCEITIHGNAQDAVGDTMNDGTIVVSGSIGDAAGYAMRGGAIYIKGNAGYRAGIHMKEYKEKKPVIVIGGRAGSFLGEYQAGGVIVVLGLHTDSRNRYAWRQNDPARQGGWDRIPAAGQSAHGDRIGQGRICTVYPHLRRLF